MIFFKIIHSRVLTWRRRIIRHSDRVKKLVCLNYLCTGYNAKANSTGCKQFHEKFHIRIVKKANQKTCYPVYVTTLLLSYFLLSLFILWTTEMTSTIRPRLEHHQDFGWETPRSIQFLVISGATDTTQSRCTFLTILVMDRSTSNISNFRIS